MKHYTATQARNNFGEILEEAYHTGQPVVIERRNKPMAAIVPLNPGGKTTLKDDIDLPALDLGPLKSKLSRKDIYGKEGR